MAKTERIGLLGGTFDPPHYGHLRLAEAAQSQLGLARILFLPVGQPVHKMNRSVSTATDRLQMTRLAIADYPQFVLDKTDLERPGPHTTVSLLPLLQQRRPTAVFWLLLGTDSLRNLPTWAEPQQLIKLCRLGILRRPGVEIAWPALETAVPGLKAAVDWLAAPGLALSATEIRTQIAQGISVQSYLPTAVLAYIQQQNLYQSRA